MYLNSYFLLWQIERQCQGHEVVCITQDITYLSILFVPHTRFYRQELGKPPYMSSMYICVWYISCMPCYIMPCYAIREFRHFLPQAVSDFFDAFFLGIYEALKLRRGALCNFKGPSFLHHLSYRAIVTNVSQYLFRLE